MNRSVKDLRSVLPVEGGPTDLAGNDCLRDCQTALHVLVVS